MTNHKAAKPIVVVGQQGALKVLHLIKGQNILLAAPPGCGKTHIALYYASMLNRTAAVINCRSDGALAKILKAINLGVMPILDEVHALGNSIEVLYPYIDSRRTVFAATTTDEGKLPPAALSRFFLISLAPYSEAEIAVITQQAGASPQHAATIARLARGNPRRAIHLARLIPQDTQDVYAFLDAVGLRNGLTERERAILRLTSETPRSLATLSSLLGCSPETISFHESFLLSTGLLQITHKGRSATPEGKALL